MHLSWGSYPASMALDQAGVPARSFCKDPERFSLQEYGADDGARTRGLHHGKVALYQLSYVRKMVGAVRIELTTSGLRVPCSTG